ncbi:MFS general substrate transporter [Ramaria rubella]|nr:MFS general substrate transporter [Ramaria rubella]
MPSKPPSPTSTVSFAARSRRPPTYRLSFADDGVALDLTPAPQLHLAPQNAQASAPRRSRSRQSRRISTSELSVRPVTRRVSALPPPAVPPPGKGRGRDFWLVFIAVCSSTFLEALDFTTVSTALPTIVNELKGADKFTWIGAAYTLSSTAFQPLTGALADVLGRRPCMLASLCLFALGSALCGAAQNMDMLIAGRTVQGMGAAGIGSLSDIIVADLVPLKDRGTYMGILSAIWAVASAIGPSIGGVFAQKLSWRWLFYVNIPLTAFSLIMVYFFLKLKSPKDHIMAKLARVDWLGNVIIIAGATAVVIALTWGGVTFPWQSYQVLIPLILGLCLTAFFLYYEKRWAAEPSVPFELLSNMTSLSGYLGTFFHGILSTAVVYYLPVYFQAVKEHSPVKSGIDMLEISLTIAPVAIITGVSVAIFNRYRIQNYVGWVISIVGFAVLSLIDADTHGAKLAGLQLPAAVGVGILYAAVSFPVLAPLGVSENAHALAFFIFVRTFSYTFGIAIGSTVMQNELSKRLPPAFIALFPPHQDLAYAAIDVIPGLEATERRLVQQEFAASIAVIWRVLAGIAGAGLVSCLIMKEIPMSDELDEAFALDGAGGAIGEGAIGAGKRVGIDVEMEMKEDGGVDGTSYVVRSPRSPEYEPPAQ